MADEKRQDNRTEKQDQIDTVPTSSKDKSAYTAFTLIGGAALVAAIVALAVSLGSDSSTAAPPPPTPPSTTTEPGERAPITRETPDTLEKSVKLQVVDEAECPSTAPAAKRRTVGNPEARAAAQNALSFLGRESTKWSKGHACYGCHVHAVTLEGFVVGKANQYEVDEKAFSTIVRDIVHLPGGSRTKGGFEYKGGTLLHPAKAFGGAALASYDAKIDKKLSDDVLETAHQLLEYQRPDGSYDMRYDYRPVSAGDVTGTWQAVRTWKQAYDISADDKWLAPIARAETWLRKHAKVLLDNPNTRSQDLHYVLMGLVDAGVGASEELPAKVRAAILERQNADGGWPANKSGASVVLETGQALFALRMAGLADSDPVIEKGMGYLIKRQTRGGGWSNGGSAKAEAMWGVLGLVSLDVLTVAFDGLQFGQHVDQTVEIKGYARDNEGTGVVRMELTINDIRVASSCGDDLTYSWNTAGAGDKKHVLVLSAENADGEVSKRRIELYTGNVFMTQVGTRYENNNTIVSLRNIAPNELDNKVRLTVYETGDKPGAVGRKLRTLELEGEEGAMSFAWDGRDDKGNAAGGNGKFVARLENLDEDGTVVQTEEVPFVHDTAENQVRDWAQVTGSIGIAGGEASENTDVELVDKEGNVVATTKTTGSGNFRFRNVDRGKYRVRMKKKGFKAEEIEFDAAPAAAPARIDVTAEAE